MKQEQLLKMFRFNKASGQLYLRKSWMKPERLVDPVRVKIRGIEYSTARIIYKMVYGEEGFDERHEVTHRNRDPQDNHLENLENIHTVMFNYVALREKYGISGDGELVGERLPNQIGYFWEGDPYGGTDKWTFIVRRKGMEMYRDKPVRYRKEVMRMFRANYDLYKMDYSDALLAPGGNYPVKTTDPDYLFWFPQP